MVNSLNSSKLLFAKWTANKIPKTIINRKSKINNKANHGKQILKNNKIIKDGFNAIKAIAHFFNLFIFKSNAS